MSELQRGAGAAWQTLMDEPATYIDDSQLPRALGNEIGADLSTRLRGCSRLAARMSALIARHEGFPPPIDATELNEDDKKIATATAGQLSIIVLRAGAILWSEVIANAVRGRDVAAIQAALGEELRSFAIGNRMVGGIDKPLEPFETLQQRIMTDGWQCYAEWCDAIPRAIGVRARLKMPAAGDTADPAARPQSKAGPAILRLAAA